MRVTIVGAGPGDPGLITVSGLRALRRAQVVVHDRLIESALLDEAPKRAERIDVGKSPGRHTMPQAAINAVLIERARRGLHVVRLKGGDPFLFGRGAEEAHALEEAGIPYRVVPGVSSAIAVPAAAGIPVTLRGVANAVTIAAGHAAAGSALDRGAADSTLVILMGVATLADTVGSLLKEGRSPHTPVAVIESGTTPRQRVVRAPLRDIAAVAARADVRPL